MNNLEKLIASTLGVRTSEVRDELAYNSIPEWDSLNHVNLMLAIERLYETTISEDDMVQLITVAAIRGFIAGMLGERP